MVDITPLVPAGRQVIQGYGDGGFRIAGEEWRGSVIVFPDSTLAWPMATIAELDQASLAPVSGPDSGVRILLVGCGDAIAPLDRGVRDELSRRGIALEVMDTGAACRTFNVLLAEERAVAAALIAIG